ncbi:MAG: SH3 domain-containing protein [Propionibacteriales bacterium]|nr:SH3 domain-containing protein [Propionibacteriales bacterium]
MFNIKRITAATLAGAAVALALLPGAAQADDDIDDMHWMGGTVTGNLGANIRSTPNLERPVVGTMNYGEKFKAICKTKGASVGGNTTWYGIPAYSEVPYYVSGRFVDVPDDFELGPC